MSEPFSYGGQAVIEGVMMRGRRAMAVAVRHPSGMVVLHDEPVAAHDGGHGWGRWASRPLLRGIVHLYDTLLLGMRALAFSATVAAEAEAAAGGGQPRISTGHADSAIATTPAPADEEREMHISTGHADSAIATAAGGDNERSATWGMGIALGAALLIAVGVFFVGPLLLVRLVEELVPIDGWSVLLEGAIRLGLFFGYLWGIGRFPDVQRVFAYHGAEHKAINAFEAGVPLDAAHVARFGVLHPRCGTSFLLYVALISVAVFALAGHPPLPLRLATRVVLVPVIAALAYELIRFAGRHRQYPLVQALLAPGLALQTLTTRQPDESQIEVAICALRRALELDASRDQERD